MINMIISMISRNNLANLNIKNKNLMIIVQIYLHKEYKGNKIA
jgi:hypothetical protein